MKKSLTLTLLLGVVVIEVTMLSLLVWNSVRLIHSSHAEIFQRTVQEESWLLSNLLVNGLTVRDRAILNDNLQPLKDNKNFVYAAVYDRRGNLMANVGPLTNNPTIDKNYNDALSDGVYDIKRTINFYGNQLGTLYAGFSVDEVNQLTKSTQKQNTSIAAVEIVLSILVTVLTALYLAKRIKLLDKGADALRHGNYQYRIPENQDELGRLAKSFNSLAATLEETQSHLHKERAALVSAAEYAQRANQAKTQFLSNMSHELRTPLNAIMGYADIAKESVKEHLNNSDVEDIVENIETIEKSSRHLLSLINDVLDISNLDTETIEVNRIVCSIKQIIQEVTSTVSVQLFKNNNIVTVYLDPSRDTIFTDPERLKQILVNIVRNAANYTKNGEVCITVKNDNEHFSITVNDTGIGIEECNIKHIFEAFFQVDDSHTRAVQGTGLGLTIVRNLCRLLGAGIRVTSQPDVGSTFTVVFPQAELAEPGTSIQKIA